MFDVRAALLLHENSEDVRKYAAEQELSEEQALQAGMEQKAREFTDAGAEIYAKT